jgi:hypothetical protein
MHLSKVRVFAEIINSVNGFSFWQHWQKCIFPSFSFQLNICTELNIHKLYYDHVKETLLYYNSRVFSQELFVCLISLCQLYSLKWIWKTTKKFWNLSTLREFAVSIQCGGITQIDKQILPPQTGLYSVELISNFNQFCWRYYYNFFGCDTVGFSKYMLKFWRKYELTTFRAKEFW